MAGPIVLRLATIERQTFAQELVTVTGLLSMSLLVSAAVLPARLRTLTRGFGIEAVLGNHRVLGAAAAVTVLLHVAAVVLADPRNAALLALLAPPQTAQTFVPGNIQLAPPRAIAAVAATTCLVALVLAAARPRGRYELWRAVHLALAAGVLVAAAAHVVLIGHLLPASALIAWVLGDPAWLVVLRGDVSFDPVAAGFLVALGATVVVVGVRRWLVRPLERQGRYRVSRVDAVAPTVSTIVLRPDEREQPLKFEPGQFAWLRLARDAFTEEHPFTISSAAQDGGTVEFTIRHTGDWTSGPLRRIREGDFVWLDGPHGALTPDDKSPGLVLIAGGVGITPMMSILRTAALEGDRRPIRLLLADRPGEGLFRDELRRLHRELQLEIHEMGRAPLTADLVAGVLPSPWLRNRLDYFVCGSPSLVRDTVAALGALDIPARQVHTEQFWG